VNYFNATAGTPSPALLATYDCVVTPGSPAATRTGDFRQQSGGLRGRRGKVVLGVFCTFTTVASLGGRIMTSGYSPVTSPPGTKSLLVFDLCGGRDHLPALGGGGLWTASTAMS